MLAAEAAAAATMGVEKAAAMAAEATGVVAKAVGKVAEKEVETEVEMVVMEAGVGSYLRHCPSSPQVHANNTCHPNFAKWYKYSRTRKNAYAEVTQNTYRAETAVVVEALEVEEVEEVEEATEEVGLVELVAPMEVAMAVAMARVV